MIIHLTIGAIAMAGIFLLINYTQKQDIKLSWWQWALTVLGVIYGIFVLELIVGFIGEGAGQAALVMGLLTGVVAVIWGVLLGRFVFNRA
jgi:hypothetical protein